MLKQLKPGPKANMCLLDSSRFSKVASIFLGSYTEVNGKNLTKNASDSRKYLSENKWTVALIKSCNQISHHFNNDYSTATKMIYYSFFLILVSKPESTNFRTMFKLKYTSVST